MRWTGILSMPIAGANQNSVTLGLPHFSPPLAGLVDVKSGRLQACPKSSSEAMQSPLSHTEHLRDTLLLALRFQSGGLDLPVLDSDTGHRVSC